jgi:VWFA-related protein
MFHITRLTAIFACVVLANLGQMPVVSAFSQESRESQIQQGPQLIPRSESDREANYQAEHHIILNVRVLDDAGKAVTGLRPSDFTLADNGREVGIASLREAKGVGAPVPPRVMLLLDAVNDAPRDLRATHDGIEHFLSGGDGPTEFPISLALFTGSGITANVPTQDRSRLQSELASLMKLKQPAVCGAGVAQSTGLGLGPMQGSRVGSSCQNTLFKMSVPALARLAEQQVRTPGRLILVWFGEGWPRLSGNAFVEDSPELKLNFFDYLIELSGSLQEGQVTLDAVALTGRLNKLDPRKDLEAAEHVTSAKQASAESLSLQALALESGGMALGGPDDLSSKIATCVADAESYYVLAFDSTVAKTPGEYHAIEVKVDKPGLTVRTTRYYYAAP